MHHKRKNHKSTRAGCLLCKPHKATGNKCDTAHTKRWIIAQKQDIMYYESQ